MSIEQLGSRERHRKLDLPNGVAEVWLERAGDHVTMRTVRPNGSGAGNWVKCDVNGCLGQAVVSGSKCLGHASGASRLQYLSDLYDSHGSLLLCGVEVSQELIDSILGSPIVEDRRIRVPINLIGAEINARLDFTDITFEGQFNLIGAIVRQPAVFRKCVFERHLPVQFAFFNAGPPSFSETKFCETVDFSYAHAERVSIGFTDCTFAKPATADGIEADLHLNNCRFRSDLAIRAANAPFILLKNCSVDGMLDVANTQCGIFRATYLRSAAAHAIGPLEVKNDCTLSHSHLDARIAIEMRGKHLDLSGAQLVQGGHILVDEATVSLKQLSAGRLLQISGKSNGTKEPQILTLHDADAGSMAFAHVDMSRCIFYGAHDLGSVVIEPTVKFASTPMGYTRRRCVADEFA